MKVFHDDHGWPAPADVRRDRCGDRALAARARGVVHRVVKRAPFAGLREIEDVVQKHDLVGTDGPGCGNLFRGGAPFVGAGRRPQLQQAVDDRADRVLVLAHAEIEHEAAVAGKAQRFGEAAHLVDEPCLADARLAAYVHDVTGPLFETRVRDALELLEFSLAADKHAAACRDRFESDTAQTPHAHRRVDALEAHRAGGVAQHRLPSARCTLSESNVSPGPAAATSRAARFTESPSTV